MSGAKHHAKLGILDGGSRSGIPPTSDIRVDSIVFANQRKGSGGAGGFERGGRG